SIMQSCGFTQTHSQKELVNPTTTAAIISTSNLLQPTSPLFPYTTLFRSLIGPESRLLVHFSAGVPQAHQRRDVTAHHVPLRVEQDRKSTRLNSSHVSISYAVFCLKKKSSNQKRLDLR